ncbi:MAG: BLUF domain-containing protein [Cyclobacteriaceae bacterium]|nr:BLUF domain-containing protein [Cyclobacteriaceae bacterium]UYN88373.1 MAG: BLUF domain-containing protein [Cyclobacteriaceae bacterium]
MYHLVYTSHATNPLTPEELIQLLKESRLYNKQHHITGMLLYLNGKFIQILEGKKEDVTGVYANICRDKRHHRVITIMEGNSPSRIFHDWSMGFKMLSHSEFEDITGFKDIDHFFERNKAKDKGNLLYTFLTLFYKKNIVDYAELPE